MRLLHILVRINWNIKVRRHYVSIIVRLITFHVFLSNLLRFIALPAQSQLGPPLLPTSSSTILNLIIQMVELFLRDELVILLQLAGPRLLEEPLLSLLFEALLTNILLR